MFIGRTDTEAETPTLWPPDAKSWLIGKDPDAGKDWGQEEKGMTEDEIVGFCNHLSFQNGSPAHSLVFSPSSFLQRLRAGEEEGNRGWDGWMASLTQWTWVWANSRSWWRTGKPGMVQSMESQRVRHDRAMEQQKYMHTHTHIHYKWWRRESSSFE